MASKETQSIIFTNCPNHVCLYHQHNVLLSKRFDHLFEIYSKYLFFRSNYLNDCKQFNLYKNHYSPMTPTVSVHCDIEGVRSMDSHTVTLHYHRQSALISQGMSIPNPKKRSDSITKVQVFYNCTLSSNNCTPQLGFGESINRKISTGLKTIRVQFNRQHY